MVAWRVLPITHNLSRLTLFEISTTEGWVDVMYSAADSVQPYVASVALEPCVWTASEMVRGRKWLDVALGQAVKPA